MNNSALSCNENDATLCGKCNVICEKLEGVFFKSIFKIYFIECRTN